ncbi:DUF808 domain-containing protein [Fulvivirga lutea]|uniref:DUF808 domain-containing protein n=1 Tax=Fulvivirga lutea TaxID=2810512 RepID=A0A974WIN3_9BACT|nr:DUF808 family protein [Fulvivirga lutea]QSE98468.1 DUF808 domain-containing protein [Fulvivirga lutea]
MASKFFAVFDDIAVLMDDVATMSKYATQKTAGILADDLAVNAEKASGFSASRELIVLWRIAKGSLLNKIIILPAAFLLSAFLPGVIIPILLLGGLYLAYEGVEKVYTYLFHRESKEKKKQLLQNDEQAASYENEKVKSAIVVDFILSVEIIIIALSTVADQPLNIQIPVVTVVALLATVGVYGLVALIVRMDNLGLNLIASSENKSSFKAKLGRGLVKLLPWVVRSLTVLGTLAMILVGGGIYAHNVDFIHNLLRTWPTLLADFLVGLCLGALAVVVMKLYESIKKNFAKAT